jgi:hypothetical protein
MRRAGGGTIKLCGWQRHSVGCGSRAYPSYSRFDGAGGPGGGKTIPTNGSVGVGPAFV